MHTIIQVVVVQDLDKPHCTGAFWGEVKQCKVYSAQCTANNVHYVLYNVQCTVYQLGEQHGAQVPGLCRDHSGRSCEVSSH